MATSTSLDSIGSADHPQQARAARPVLAWAALGAGFVALFVYLLVMWVASGDFKPTPAGNIPTYTRVAAWILQIGQAVLVPVFLYRVVVRPWRRDRNLSTDGVICLAMLTTWWADTVCNSLADFTNNSAAFINFGSWDRHIPGWVQPNGNLVVEPPLGSSGIMYLWANLSLAMLGCQVIRVVQQRWRRGVPVALVGSVVVIGVVTMALELLALRLGLWSYQGAQPGWTFFHGAYYQFPIYEALLFGILGTVWACIRYFRNDKGQTIAERGIDTVSGPPWRKNVLRVLAMGGLLNVVFLAFWQLPMAHIATQQAAWPNQIVDRPWLTNRVCGPHTGYACPGPDIPLSRPGSIHIGPDGQTIVPPGAALPTGGTTSTK